MMLRLSCILRLSTFGQPSPSQRWPPAPVVRPWLRERLYEPVILPHETLSESLCFGLVSVFRRNYLQKHDKYSYYCARQYRSISVYLSIAIKCYEIAFLGDSSSHCICLSQHCPTKPCSWLSGSACSQSRFLYISCLLAGSRRMPKLRTLRTTKG